MSSQYECALYPYKGISEEGCGRIVYFTKESERVKSIGRKGGGRRRLTADGFSGLGWEKDLKTVEGLGNRPG
jgi:hypothetical protein